MTLLDLAFIFVLALWTLHGFARGIIRAVIGLASWLIGVVVALHLAAPVAAMLPEFLGPAGARNWIAFVLVLLGVLVVGALLGSALARLIKAIGLGALDRLLGGVFGFACGVLFALVFAFVAGLTGVSKHDWWQNSTLGPVLAAAVSAAAPWLPQGWVGRLDYPGIAPPPVGPARSA